MAHPALSPAVAGALPAAVRKSVLIVEDNPLNMKLFSAMLAAQGYDVLEATDGAHGLDMAQHRHPDLIIMDIQLPSMSGLEVTRTLKSDEATRDIPIIATTAFAMRGDEEKILASGCDGYMAKPIAISQFLELIETFMLKTAAGAPEQVS
jgi:two-component system cell cycle response regulator DivK